MRWVQEELANMGAWNYMLCNYCGVVDMKLVSRPASPSPATGYKKRHEKQLEELMEAVFKV